MFVFSASADNSSKYQRSELAKGITAMQKHLGIFNSTQKRAHFMRWLCKCSAWCGSLQPFAFRNLGIKLMQLNGAKPKQVDAVSGHNETTKDLHYGLRGINMQIIRQNCGLLVCSPPLP